MVAVYTTETEKRRHYYDTHINVPSKEKDLKCGGGGGGCLRELLLGSLVQNLVKQNANTMVSLWSVIWILSALKHSKIR